MSFGKLQFILFVGEESLPVTDAEIIIINTDTAELVSNKVVKVDNDGKTKPISLYTYDKYLSEEPDVAIKPYKTYDAIILSNKFQNKYIKGIPIFSGVTSIQKVQMTPKVRGESSIDVIDIPPNALTLPPSLLKKEKDFENLKSDASSKLLKDVVIPEYITVHLGTPTSYAENVTVPFTDYIKNVASSEIYPTWPKEALKSNIYAEISFTLNRIYTEWYRSRGYDFDITNSTAYDHYFVNGRNYFDTISDVVDEIFNEYISRKGFKEPLLAQYCNGTTVTCDGLSQWGTVTYANNGDSAYQILKKYYGDNIEIRTADYVEGAIESYPGKALKLGDKGEDVKIIQQQLNRIRKNYPGIPEITNENGEFNEATKNAVKTFQKIFNLTPDGIVGKKTWYKISQIYVGVKKLAELNSEGEKLPLPDKVPTNILRLGDKGEEVKNAQFLLKAIGTFYDNILPIEVTGEFDKNMEEVVKSFQSEFGLDDDGIIGPKTWSKLIEVYKIIEPYILTGSGEFIKYPGYLIKKGKRGEDVRLIQEWLNEIHKKYQFIPEVSVDGIFGEKTKEAIMIFQRWQGLIADGIVGPLTWDKLYEIYREVIKENFS
ncbi:peptidoglycan-binding protein [Clostridium nigeriense]|uniref:peptidoglycan-binding protein n=1 Tax=Clostridium nigeriense TaxID=1805470 RepID=UPI000AD4718B|nr:peptidoglycan-binding protein [Clostridium nigeriense]